MEQKWIKACKRDELPPGGRKLCTVQQRRIALFNLDGVIHAIDNHCTHRDGPVGAGQLSDCVITCPWHGWRFDVTTGSCLEPGGENLHRYPVQREGDDVLIDVAAPGEENDEGISCYLVRYGALGHVSRVGSPQPIPCQRGDRAIIHTDRGIEAAEVLETPGHDAGGGKPTGELLRVMTEEDERLLQQLEETPKEILELCQQSLARRSIPVTAIDAEQLFDRSTVIIYYLGQPSEKLGPLAVELSKTADGRRVQFQPIETGDSAETQREEAERGEKVREEKPKGSRQEGLKWSSGFLRGTIAEELHRDSERFASENAAVLKFHGTYQQDDRDARKRRRTDGSKAGKHYEFMVRTKTPGGKLTAGQFLAELDLGERYGNGSLRITTRQGLQLHGVVKRDLQPTLRRINDSLMTTLGACGDVVRNVMCCPAPHRSDRVRGSMQATANEIARHFTPRTSAYYEIWVDGEKQLEQPLSPDVEPIYGRTYLPRKFKIGLAPPEDNCIDVYTQDVGLLAVVQEGRIAGYNVLVGGGLGVTPSVKETFPRLADPLAFVAAEDLLRVLTAIVEVQRDHGNRENRRRARMKYLVDQWGVQRFRETVEQYLGRTKLAAPHAVRKGGIDDHLGWHPQGDGRFYFGLFVENGRIQDRAPVRLMTGLRRLLERFRMPVRLTPQQNLLLCDLQASWQEELWALLREHGIQAHNELSSIRRHAMACPALPTCGLAITESERVLPGVIDRLEAEAARLGLDADDFTVRMTGCPNGCARPYTADIGLVGKAAGKYTILVGGRLAGDRLNRIYKDMVPLEELVDELLPLLSRYKSERHPGEALGDFCDRTSLSM